MDVQKQIQYTPKYRNYKPKRKYPPKKKEEDISTIIAKEAISIGVEIAKSVLIIVVPKVINFLIKKL